MITATFAVAGVDTAEAVSDRLRPNIKIAMPIAMPIAKTGYWP